MALNPFFLQGSANEQYLIQDLINEQLKIYGIDVYYLPRKFIRTDNILKEVETSKFDDNFIIEAYLDNYEGYAPGSDLMTKFGLRLKNEINLIISQERFEEFITPFLDGLQQGINDGNITDYDINLITRPREGDLIYFPLGQRLFEIKRVEAEKPFYQLNKTYVYELLCELFEYENEDIDTGVDEVDRVVEDEGYITTLQLENSAVDATATAALGGNDMVGQIVLNNDGKGYTSTPTVTIANPVVGGGITATAVAITTEAGGVYSIESIRITNAGSGYTATNPPLVTITGGNGVGAAATAVVVDSGIRLLTITDDGNGYFTAPTVTITGPSGAGVTATAVATIETVEGTVTSLQIVNAGSGYASAPTVAISTAGSTGIGTFIYNETVTGSISSTTAQVRGFRIRDDISASDPPYELYVAINDGKFTPGESIVGAASSASYILKSYDTNSHEESYDTNEEIEIAADSLLDFTESNPFGEY
jgi:hypothetical protein